MPLKIVTNVKKLQINFSQIENESQLESILTATKASRCKHIVWDFSTKVTVTGEDRSDLNEFISLYNKE